MQAAQEMDLSTKLPADASARQPAQIVIGSLDINQGAVLPAEELVGRCPAVSVEPFLFCVDVIDRYWLCITSVSVTAAVCAR